MSKEVSRRQFLSYTLTGVGGFMAASILSPLTRFAIDPVLKGESKGEMIAVMDIKDITDEPQRVDFQVHQVDGWYESDVPQSAWVFRDDKGEILALSPVCKHLGCTVDWNTDPVHPNEFFCPCHYGRYYKDGRNVPGTPPLAGLDIYKHQEKGGKLLLGKPVPRDK